MKCAAFNAVGINPRYRKEERDRKSLSGRICKTVRSFFERDDVSRMTAGIKNTVTSKKVKKQRRILKDSLKALYLKYISEVECAARCSYTTFCRLRPFWVVFPNESDRNTCQCKTCENTSFMACSLKESCVIDTDKLEDIIQSISCDIENKECMYGECKKCSENRVDFNKNKMNEDIQWKQWMNKSEKRTIKTGQQTVEKEVTFTVKESFDGTVSDLTERFEQQLSRYKQHLFNIKCQYRYFRERKDGLQENECILHVDFSENFVCKMHSEIQSMHFGASKRQLTLHTGVMYSRMKTAKPKTFCTVSESLNHGPAAVWAHLKPVLEDIRTSRPLIDTIEFFSDGPTTQYRQKGNFYLFSTEIHQMGFRHAVWNFFEAGHGKGIPDAVGGAIKRSADKKIKYGVDIMSAATFVHQMQKSESSVYLVDEKEILKYQHILDNTSIETVKGTMKLHQLISCTPGAIACRDLSSLETKVCKDKGTKHVQFKDTTGSTKRKMKDEKPTQTKKKRTKTCRKLKEKDRNRIFEGYLNELKSCKSFNQLKKVCAEVTQKMPADFKMVPQEVSILGSFLEVDSDALDIYPGDVPTSVNIFPCIATADGNCLPSCGSTFAFGAPENTAEMRVRILAELVLHEETYLDNAFLQQGLANVDLTRNLPRIYAQYSDMFVPGMNLTNDVVATIFRMELRKIRLDKSYMGIWQIHALSSVLNVPIFSVYPELGNPNVRLDLHRIVVPRNGNHDGEEPVHILWSSTRNEDMVAEHWVPNHFVPVVPVQNSVMRAAKNTREGNGTEKPKEQRGVKETEEKAKEEEAAKSANKKARGVETSKRAEEKVREEEEAKKANEQATDDDSAKRTNEKAKEEKAAKRAAEKARDGEAAKRAKEKARQEEAAEWSNEKARGDEAATRANVKAGENEAAKGVSEKASGEEAAKGASEKGREEEAAKGASENRREEEAAKGASENGREEEAAKGASENGREEEAAKGVSEEASEEEAAEGASVKGKEEEAAKGGSENGREEEAAKGASEEASEEEAAKGASEKGREEEAGKRVDKKARADETAREEEATKRANMKEREEKAAKSADREVRETSESADERAREEETIIGKETKSKNRIGEEMSADVKNSNIEQDCQAGLNTVSAKIEWEKIPDISLLVGKYIVVEYDGNPFPGYVEDVDASDIYVECMHKVGKWNKNTFYWPKKIKDKCWYQYDVVLGVIPEPRKIEGEISKFQVEPSVWEGILMKYYSEKK